MRATPGGVWGLSGLCKGMLTDHVLPGITLRVMPILGSFPLNHIPGLTVVWLWERYNFVGPESELVGIVHPDYC